MSVSSSNDSPALGAWFALGLALAASSCGDDAVSTVGTGGRGGAGGSDGVPSASSGLATTGSASDGGAGGAPPEVSISLLFSREAADGPDLVVARATIVRDGEPTSDLDVTMLASGEPVAIEEIDAGVYEARITPPAERVEVPVRVEAGGAALERTAVVLFEVDEAWGQAEAVPGLVNTPAYEDSPEISPDGEWLIVSNYSPLDLLSCILPQIAEDPPGSGLPACNTVVGPYAAPARPDLPGAERIVSPTQVNHFIPSLGITAESVLGLPLPPVGAYGFRRQPDGTFAEPFAIAYTPEVLGAPFGFNFVGTPTGDTADVIFSLFDPVDEDIAGDLVRATLQLGERNVLGTVSGTFPALTTTPAPARLDQPSFFDLQSNPCAVADGVYFDQHDNDPDREFDLLFYPGSIGGPLEEEVVVAVSQPDRAEYQPYEHQGTLYYVAEFAEILSSERIGGGPPDASATWGDERLEVSIYGGDGNIVAIGEPSLATHDGITWMYFLYGMTTESGLDSNIARIPLRP